MMCSVTLNKRDATFLYTTLTTLNVAAEVSLNEEPPIDDEPTATLDIVFDEATPANPAKYLAFVLAMAELAHSTT